MDGIKVIHDSQSMKYRKPFGSVEQGQKVKLSIDIDKEIRQVLHDFARETFIKIYSEDLFLKEFKKMYKGE